MNAAVQSLQRGRVLLVGEKHASVRALEQLTVSGFRCQVAENAGHLLRAAEQLDPEAILFTSSDAAALAVIRADARLAQLPVLGDLTGRARDALRALRLDDWIHSDEELTSRLESALTARRLMERDFRQRRRMETLLEITQAATSSLELTEILRFAVDKIGAVVESDRCSVVLVESSGPRVAQVVASRNIAGFAPLQLDLARYPELRRALETRQPVFVEDAPNDPLMAEVKHFIQPIGVRAILVQPLICQDDMLGALFLRLSRLEGGFGEEEREFARAAAFALANSVRNAQLHTALRRKMQDLESAYVDRYRELSEANRRLKEVNRLKDELLAICSHDLRAPLNVLLGHGRILLDGQLSPPQQGSVEAMVRQGRKILELVESLLEHGKTDLSRVTIEPRLLDLAELCQEAAGELEILASQKGICLRAEAPESVMVLGDELKLREVLDNLVTNAIHHAKEAGTVTLQVRRLNRPDGQAARLSVADDGVGIAADQLHTVFDRYRHGGGGTGLGLSICKEFVELHGGEIWAERPPEGGSLFVFTLPLARHAQEPLPKMATFRPGAEQARVLVVEDEPEVAAILSELLRSRYRVEIARDGAEGLAKARALHPDLIVMDVFLPKLDGLDAAVALKQSTDTVGIPVILLSAHQGVADKVRALNLGAVDYMSKPFQALELLARTERALNLRSSEPVGRPAPMEGNDPVTGLLDRTGLLARLDQEASRSLRYQRPLCMAALKPITSVGDKVEACAALLRKRLRSPDVLGHLGDGLLAMLLPECRAQEMTPMLLRVVQELERELGVVYRSAAVDVATPEDRGEPLLTRLFSKA